MLGELEAITLSFFGVCLLAIPVGVAIGWAMFRGVNWMDARSEHRCSPGIFRLLTALLSFTGIMAVALTASAWGNSDTWSDRVMLGAVIFGGIPAAALGAGLGQRSGTDN